jgi:hypothetical protein
MGQDLLGALFPLPFGFGSNEKSMHAATVQVEELGSPLVGLAL